MPLATTRDDASVVKSLGSCPQGLCVVGGSNSGTVDRQNESDAFPRPPSPSNSSAFDSSIPSCSMISNSSHPALDHMSLKSVARSTSPVWDLISLLPAPRLEGGWPSIDDVIVMSSAHSGTNGSFLWNPRSTSEIRCWGRRDERLHNTT